ncbi:MAG: hypothetical protein R2911_07355 [Caldilineaceae bacterium]
MNTGVLNGNAAFILQVGLKMIGITLLGNVFHRCRVLGIADCGIYSGDMRGDLFKRVQTFSNLNSTNFRPPR